MIVIENNKNEMLKFFTSDNTDFNSVNIEGNTALMTAAKNNNKSAVDYLINNNANIDCKNIYGEDAISLAHNSSTDLVNILLKGRLDYSINSTRPQSNLSFTGNINLNTVMNKQSSLKEKEMSNKIKTQK